MRGPVTLGHEEVARTTQFEFIDITSSNARKKARAHVMRQFMRQKRGDRSDQDSVPEEVSDEEGAVVRNPVRKRRNIDNGGSRESAQAETEYKEQAAVGISKLDKLESPTTRSSTSKDSSRQTRSDGSVSSESPSRKIQLAENSRMRFSKNSRSSSPQSQIDGSKRDPFQSFRMRLSYEDMPLVDHCKLRVSPKTLTRC